MKKLLTLGLSLLTVVAVLSLSACGQQESGANGGDSAGQPAQPEGGASPDTGGMGTTEGGAGATPAEPATGN
ncbi:hypothetical protein [Fischerella thermalis]|uniref:Uncharacterized protein n=1 Tax=Fischerella thermalis CCMEE 5318 TaxID=2019666 RepID=A0A2N6L6C0_9CYAN|nr:hypothetical protein [Fischerella thermalis]PMB17461.1 hypothetical protein CEN46_23490 [Fischerella thermalis CCMEE 5318]